MQALFVYITAPDATTADRIANALVRERFAACANIIDGMRSVYWWQGALEQGSESVLIVKCTQEGYPALEKRVQELHPFEVPCIVALPIQNGFPPFVRWIAEETAPGQQEER